ncbi:MAG: hypothetical protein M5U19_00235 [Microthrixaceae bacterium]|nr:hypothetical protein [Microthrixaceae bacterium]
MEFPDGSLTSHTWDAFGRRDTVTGPDGFTQRYAYDNEGDVEAIKTRHFVTDRFVGPDGAGLDPVKWDLTGSAQPTIQNQQATFAVTASSGSNGRMNSNATLAGGYDTTYTLDLGDRSKNTTVRGLQPLCHPGIVGTCWSSSRIQQPPP